MFWLIVSCVIDDIILVLVSGDKRPQRLWADSRDEARAAAAGCLGWLATSLEARFSRLSTTRCVDVSVRASVALVGPVFLLVASVYEVVGLGHKRLPRGLNLTAIVFGLCRPLPV